VGNEWKINARIEPNVSSFFTRLLARPVAVAMLFGALLLGGVFAFTRLPIELSPTVEFPSLSIHTSWGNTSPETVEMFLTAPIEEIANTIQGAKKVSSRSTEGRSVVDVEFEQSTDMNFARLELYEKLAAFGEFLPPGASLPTIERYVPEDFRALQGFMTFTLAGELSPSALRTYAQERLASALLSIKGVAKVEVVGGEEREIQIELHLDKLKGLGLTVDKIAASLRAVEFSASVGVLKQASGRIVVSIQNKYTRVADLLTVPLHTTDNGTVIRLGDLGEVRDGLAELRSFSRVNGKPSVNLVVDKEPHINTLRVADAVMEKLEEMSKQFPSGVELRKVEDKSEQLRNELESLYREVLISLLCIWAVLSVFLQSQRASFVILSSIVFSLAGTFLFFWFFGLSLHLLTMAGLILGFGRVVDDSIVVLDNIQRHSTEGPTTERIQSAVAQVFLPVVASTLTTVGAMLPLAFLPEDLKPYFLDFGIAVGVSLLMSLLVSFTLIPTMACHVKLWKSQETFMTRTGELLARLYQKMLKVGLKYRKSVLATIVLFFGLPIWLLPERIEAENPAASAYNSIVGNEYVATARPFINHALGGVSYLFFTKVTKGEVWDWGNETYLVVRIGFPQGTEIQRYDQVAAAVEREIQTNAHGVKKFTTRVTGELASVRVDFDDSAAATAIPYEMKNRLTVFAAQTGGATISVSGFGPGFYSGGESSPSFYVKVLGYNYNKVKEIAEKFKERIERNPRIGEVDIDRSFGRWSRTTELVVRVNREAISSNGLAVVDVVRSMRGMTRGAVEWHTLSLSNERVPYTLKLAGYDSFSVDLLRSAHITNPNGQIVQLASLVDIEERRVPSEITREDQHYLRWISFEYKGPYKYGNAFVDATITSMPLPIGYRFDRSFSFFFLTEKSQRSLVWIALIALLIVFMVTSSLYESFIKPLVVIIAVPLSLIGLCLAFYLTDTPFGRGGYASVILLIGIAVSNSIVLVDYVNKYVALQSPSLHVLVHAATDRLRPILMTSITTIGALIPLLIWSERASIWYSLALGTIGGMISSTSLVLFIIPIILSYVHRVIRQ
jgi:HAE1 family hydrophobic/amphiphilic exporter-1